MKRPSSSMMTENVLEGCQVIEEKVGNIPIIVICAKHGYLSSSYLSIETADKVGDVAAVVRNAKDLEDFMKGKVDTVTSWAEDMGLRQGMSVKRAIKILKGEEKI